jgi:uroporphyrinogen decarboxylase
MERSLEFSVQPHPDFSCFENVLRLERKPDRIPLYELFSNIEPQVLEYLDEDTFQKIQRESASEAEAALRIHIQYMHKLGYDYINLGAHNFEFTHKNWADGETGVGNRSYQQAADSTIRTREDFEAYSFPQMEHVDYTPFETIPSLLPEGMKAIPGFSGILENVLWLMGMEAISYRLFDDPGLVEAMFEQVATRIIHYFDTVCQFECVGAVYMGDDMGWRTQTLVSPDTLRKYVFPWHQKLVSTVRRYDKPIILHACGNLMKVMDDIIACGWNAKHSFEDAIEPVWEAKKRYGDRIALLGGFDVDKLCRMRPAEIRSHTDFLIEKCAGNGGWACGTGNSVAEYIPMENFLTMIDQVHRSGRYS